MDTCSFPTTPHPEEATAQQQSAPFGTRDRKNTLPGLKSALTMPPISCPLCIHASRGLFHQSSGHPHPSLLSCPCGGCLHTVPAAHSKRARAQAPRQGTPGLWEVSAPGPHTLLRLLTPALPQQLAKPGSDRVAAPLAAPLGHASLTGAEAAAPFLEGWAPLRAWWHAPSAGHKAWGTAGTRGLSPGQQTHSPVVGLRAEQQLPATLPLQEQHLRLIASTAQQRFHRLHCEPVCTAKPRSHPHPRPCPQGHSRHGGAAMQHLTALLGADSSPWHSLQISASSGDSSVVKEIWKSSARKICWKKAFTCCR